MLKWRKKHSVKRSEILIPVKCRNCGTECISRYCHNCGQDIFSGRERSVGEIIYNAFDTVFAFDSNILRTLKYLIFFPGKLSKEYCDGKIVKFVQPAKLFWFITILFLMLFSLGNNSEDSVASSNEEGVENIFQVNINNADKDLSKNEDKGTLVGDFTQAQEAEFIQTFRSYFPYVMFMMIPFFSVLLQMFFHKKRRFFANQMVFALHFHSFVFLLFMILMVIGRTLSYINIPNPYLLILILFLYLLLPAIYFTVALHVFYKPKKRWLLIKVPIIMIVYTIALVVVFLLSFCIIVILASDNPIEMIQKIREAIVL